MFLGVSLFTLLYFLISSLFKNEKFEIHDLITPGIIITFLSLIYYVIGFANLDLLNKANPTSYGLLFDRGMPRFKGFANNPDYINLFIIPFFFSSILYFKKKSNAKVLFSLCVISILLSMSLASIFVYIIISIVYLINNMRNFFKYFIITAIILILCSYIISQNIFIYEIFERRLSHVESGSGRFEMWNFGIQEFMNNPIFGSGIGTIKNISLEFGITNMHNTYLELLIEFGILGCIPFLFLLFSLFINKKENNSINKKFLFYSSLALILNLFTVSAQIHEMLLFQIFLTQNLNNKVNNKIIN
ncbi:O-antigen ligase family protein [Flavobacteriaceae bacterium]|nr:O-antigen ligase family protein [Flavobacteriaceae bacterium]